VAALRIELHSVTNTFGALSISLKDVTGFTLITNKVSIEFALVIHVREVSLYRLLGRPFQALLHDNISLCELWHYIFGHLHYRALPTLKRMFTGLSELHVEHDGICRGCALGKNAKGSFPRSDDKSKGILDIVHSDVCGPMIVAYLGGYPCYVIFIYDFSGKTWIFFMKTEDEVLDRFQEFSAQVENLVEKKIKVLRLDNGGEYNFDDFSDFCKEAGIKKDSIVPCNPQQNGFVERKKRSIMEDVEAMIHGQNLPMFLWA
jgi:hypothetical protein